MSREGQSVTGALLALASRGYARRLEVIGGRAWCGSCESWFEAEDLVVEARVSVRVNGRAEPTAVLGLRCPSCGAGAAWVVGSDKEASAFLSRLRLPERARSLAEL